MFDCFQNRVRCLDILKHIQLGTIVLFRMNWRCFTTGVWIQNWILCYSVKMIFSSQQKQKITTADERTSNPNVSALYKTILVQFWQKKNVGYSFPLCKCKHPECCVKQLLSMTVWKTGKWGFVCSVGCFRLFFTAGTNPVLRPLVLLLSLTGREA